MTGVGTRGPPTDMLPSETRPTSQPTNGPNGWRRAARGPRGQRPCGRLPTGDAPTLTPYRTTRAVLAKGTTRVGGVPASQPHSAVRTVQSYRAGPCVQTHYNTNHPLATDSSERNTIALQALCRSNAKPRCPLTTSEKKKSGLNSGPHIVLCIFLFIF